jgi:hypothetical protein
VDPARFDIDRWAGGGIIGSSVATRYQLGLLAQASSATLQSFGSRCSAARSAGAIGQISLHARHMQLIGRPLLSKCSNSILRKITTLGSLHFGHLDETYVLSITRRSGGHVGAMIIGCHGNSVNNLCDRFRLQETSVVSPHGFSGLQKWVETAEVSDTRPALVRGPRRAALSPTARAIVVLRLHCIKLYLADSCARRTNAYPTVPC